jgi:hypothetical protein
MHAAPLPRLRLVGGLLLTLALGACANFAGPHRYVGNVVAVPDTEVSPCQFIDELRSSSGLTGFFGPKGVDNIKQNLLRQADILGATHVVWGEPEVGYDSTTLKAKAYRCSAPQSPK